MRFASLLSGGFNTAIVVNPPEKKLAKCTSVQCADVNVAYLAHVSFLSVFGSGGLEKS